jgi:hypothetical protein
LYRRQVGRGKARESLHPMYPFRISQKGGLNGISYKTKKGPVPFVEAVPAFYIYLRIKGYFWEDDVMVSFLRSISLI